ncbi:MAG: hypothetical protein NTV54_00185 [Ignavibacteriales bacterium]|nr:hypothetical protein [Ignavibacteriales bacterium]
MPNKLVNVGLHLQMLKFGSAPDPTKPTLEDNVKSAATITLARKQHLTEVGIELSYAENRALFAVQRLLDDTQFRGNARPKKAPHGNPYHIKGDIPVLEVKIVDYLSAYGVKKTKSARGKQEFSAQGRRSALAALKSLAGKRNILVYARNVYDPKREGEVLRADLIETVDTLMEITEGGGRLRIVPSPILFDQHDTYYMILPADLYAAVVKEKQRSRVLFIEYLFYHYEKQRSAGKTSKYLITRQMETIAYEIGLGNLIETRQMKKLRSILNEYYEFARQKGYLRKYEVNANGARHEHVDKLYINASAMSELRKV